MVVKVNLVAAIIVAFMLIGCGGGETATTGLTGGGGTGGGGTGGGGTGGGGTGGGGTGGGGTGTAALSWMPPTTYTDNTTFTDLQGHNIYMDSGNGFVKIGSVNSAGVADYLVENLSFGTYIFTVTAYDSQGVESSFSNTAIITI